MNVAVPTCVLLTRALPSRLVEGGLIVVEELIAQARAAFSWDGGIEVSAGPRGAVGQIWRLEIGSARYALKEIFAEPPTEVSILAELAFARRAAEAGVRVPVMSSRSG